MSTRGKEHKSNNSKKLEKQINKEQFDSNPNTVIASSYETIIDTLSVSPSASNQLSVSWQDQINDYIILFLKYAFLVVLLTLNFLGLSVSLNCNKDQELASRVMSAIFGFFFGFVYLLVNYYTYRVMTQGKICSMDRDRLFPFKS